MNFEQVLSLLRNVLQYGGGFIAGAGWMTSTEWDTAVGIIVGLVGLGWSMWTRRNAGLIASAATVPAVQQIITTPSVAAAVPSSKVVPPGTAGAL